MYINYIYTIIISEKQIYFLNTINSVQFVNFDYSDLRMDLWFEYFKSKLNKLLSFILYIVCIFYFLSQCKLQYAGSWRYNQVHGHGKYYYSDGFLKYNILLL